MSPEGTKGQDLVPYDSGLPVVPEEQRTIRALSVGSLEEKRIEIEKLKDPQVLERYRRFCHENPELIVQTQVEVLGSKITDIRQSFPNFIIYFSEDRCAEILSRFPVVRQRIDQDQKILRRVNQQVKTAELILGTLIEDASIQVPSAEEYRNITCSHDLYCVLHDKAESTGASDLVLEMGREEFISIGQSLGKLRRLRSPAQDRARGEIVIVPVSNEEVTDEQLIWERMMAQKYSRGVGSEKKGIALVIDAIVSCGDKDSNFRMSLKELMQALGRERKRLEDGIRNATPIGTSPLSPAEYRHHPSE